MTANLQELWQRFDNEVLQALKHYYNEEDEAEYIQPLRDAIMANSEYYVLGFTIVKPYSGGYAIYYNKTYIGVSITGQGVIMLVMNFIKSFDGLWHGPTPAQFKEAWERLGI